MNPPVEATRQLGVQQVASANQQLGMHVSPRIPPATDSFPETDSPSPTDTTQCGKPQPQAPFRRQIIKPGPSLSSFPSLPSCPEPGLLRSRRPPRLANPLPASKDFSQPFPPFSSGESRGAARGAGVGQKAGCASERASNNQECKSYEIAYSRNCRKRNQVSTAQDSVHASAQKANSCYQFHLFV